MMLLRKSKRNVKRLVFHHFGKQPPKGMNAAKIRRMHIEDRGWDDIGYHGVIMPDGELQGGRPVDEAGAHTFGFNRGSLGIMFVAGLQREGYTIPTRAQLETARLLIAECRDYYGNDIDICGHRDLRPTLCPGFDIKHWLETDRIKA